MMNYFKIYFSSLSTSVLLNVCAFYLQSDFWSIFLANNVILILIPLLAINTATSSIIVIKLQEVSKNSINVFENTFKSLHSALIEQIVFIILSILLLIVRGSQYLKCNLFYLQIFDTLLLSILLNAIYVLYDTGKAVFIIVNSRNNLENENETNNNIVSDKQGI